MTKPRIITFYLPQYHPINENDKWWGKGFTDWINVAKARPRFRGHNQPHIPSELGFYDLRLEESRVAQATLAQEYGIHGFCYYHYWFNGKMLLEKPFNSVLKSKKPDFPFCLCWANENWTRRWDGLNNEVLIEQNYSEYDPKSHIEWLEKAFSDGRYIRIGGKPLLLIYNTSDIPNIKEIITSWRSYLQLKGYKGLHLCGVRSIHNKLSDDEVLTLGFDSVVDFIPNDGILKFPKISKLPKLYLVRIINKLISMLVPWNNTKKLPVTHELSYKKIANDKIKELKSHKKFFPCVIPNWDNTARKNYAHVIQNNDVDLYKKWLLSAYSKVKNYPAEEQIVFINAWNEWAEGCHLEPDIKNGRMFLEATRDSLNNISQ